MEVVGGEEEIIGQYDVLLSESAQGSQTFTAEMILVPLGAKWPEHLIKDYSIDPLGVERYSPMPFKDIVMDGISVFTTKAGFRPTHLLVGRVAEMIMRVSVNSATMIQDIPGKPPTYAGLKLVFVSNSGLELLGDVPE